MGLWYLGRDDNSAAKSIKGELAVNLGLCFSLIAVPMANNAGVSFAAANARLPCRNLKRHPEGHTRRPLRRSSHHRGRTYPLHADQNGPMTMPFRFGRRPALTKFCDFRRRLDWIGRSTKPRLSRSKLLGRQIYVVAENGRLEHLSTSTSRSTERNS
jgi:hypothetical protein